MLTITASAMKTGNRFFFYHDKFYFHDCIEIPYKFIPTAKGRRAWFDNCIAGFVTSEGDFVERFEAHVIAKKANQLDNHKANKFNEWELCSEDLIALGDRDQPNDNEKPVMRRFR